MFDAYKFDVHDSKIRSIPLDVESVPSLALEKFIGDSFDDKAKIIFLDEIDLLAHSYSMIGKDKIVLENCTNLETLRNLTPKHICLVSEVRLMRGFDYRCKEGIALMIAKQVDSTRTLT